MGSGKTLSGDVHSKGEGFVSPSIGLISGVLPEVQRTLMSEDLQSGVSTSNVLESPPHVISSHADSSHWYVLRVTYGREKKAYDYLLNKRVKAFYPTITTVKVIDGKRKFVKESRLPNLFFAYGTEDEIKSYVYDNVNLPFLRFYYRYYHDGSHIIRREPLVVPDRQMVSLMMICMQETKDVIVEAGEIQKFKTGTPVRVVDGCFKGVEGKVARYHGQQRVAVVIDGLMTVATAYIPNAFLRFIDKE